MDIQITEAQIIERMERLLGKKDKTIATLEVVIETLKDKLSEYENESTLILE